MTSKSEGDYNMYQFILNMWIVDKIKTEDKVYSYAKTGFITKEEADMIVATPKNPNLWG